jgi:hypothetical protein
MIKLSKMGNNMSKLEDGNKIIYFSYETPVVAKVGRVIYINDRFYSKTTSRHINQFVLDARGEGDTSQKVSPDEMLRIVE